MSQRWQLLLMSLTIVANWNRYDVRDFAKPVSSKGLSIHEIDIGPQEMEMYIDLEPFVNPTPYIVPEDMSLAKVR